MSKDSPGTAEKDALCDMCDHSLHHDTECGESTGYDHLNGDHECGCPGSMATQLEQAWMDGAFFYGGSSAEQWYFNEGGAESNPHRVLPPAEPAQGDPS